MIRPGKTNSYPQGVSRQINPRTWRILNRIAYWSEAYEDRSLGRRGRFLILTPAFLITGV